MGWRDYVPIVLAAESGLGNWQTQWIPCSPGSTLVLQLKWTAVAATAGTLGMDGTADPAKAATSIVPMPAWTAGTTPGVFGTWPTVGAVAASGLVIIKNPLPWMRASYVRGGGGGVGQFTGWAQVIS